MQGRLGRLEPIGRRQTNGRNRRNSDHQVTEVENYRSAPVADLGRLSEKLKTRAKKLRLAPRRRSLNRFSAAV
jgi:hypothetical protein